MFNSSEENSYLKNKSWTKDMFDYDESFIADTRHMFYEFFDSKNPDLQRTLHSYNSNNINIHPVNNKKILKKKNHKAMVPYYLTHSFHFILLNLKLT